jgi:hypothetical protein
VDWQAASVGPACVDVAHCRANLFRHGLEVADRFTVLWEQQAGLSYRPWAEIVAIIGFLDGLLDDPGCDAFGPRRRWPERSPNLADSHLPVTRRL